MDGGKNMTAADVARSLQARLESLRMSGVRDVFCDGALLAQSSSKGKTPAPAHAAKSPSPASSQSSGAPAARVQQHPPVSPVQGAVPDAPKPAADGSYPNPVIAPSRTAQELQTYPGERAKRLAELARSVESCARCPLCSTRTQTVYSRGNPNSPLMFIGEAPGADEDAQGLPFVGRAGKLLDDIVVKGMKYAREDVYICNVLKCRPPGNRNPEPLEIDACKPYLQTQIDIIDPIIIVALGRFPAQWLLESELPIGKLRGKVWDVRGRKVVCTYHPAYLLRNPSAKVEVWKDVQMVMEYFGRDKPLPMRG